jgi:hypothetical protein
LRKSYSPVGEKRSWLNLWILALTALVAFGPIQAHAYVDPNSAGPLFQFLFPMFIAIASGLTAFRRMLGRLWCRLTGRLPVSVSGERPEPEIEDRLDPS